MPQLNNKLWGIRRGKLTVIGARPSHGKSTFVLQAAKDLALEGHNVLFLNFEMSNAETAERLLCNMYRINNRDLLMGKFNEHRHQFNNFQDDVQSMQLVFSDCVGSSWKEIDTLLNNMTVKPDVVIIDYIQAIKGVGVMDLGQIDEYIKKFREMAVTYNYAAVLVSQINRSAAQGKDHTPHVHQLKGTGFLEEHADVVILLYWPYKTNPSGEEPKKYWLDIAKNRGGITGSVRLDYIPEYCLFTDPSKPKDPEDVSKESQDAADFFNGNVVEEG